MASPFFTGSSTGPTMPVVSVLDVANLRLVESNLFLENMTARIAGGGAQYEWSPASVAADDGFTVIKPADVGGAGRWLLTTFWGAWLALGASVPAAGLIRLANSVAGITMQDGAAADHTLLKGLGMSGFQFGDAVADIDYCGNPIRLQGNVETSAGTWRWGGADVGWFATVASPTIMPAQPAVDTAATSLNLQGQQGGDAFAAPGQVGGPTRLWGGEGGDGTAVLASGAGGTISIYGGPPGVNNGGGGAAAGNVLIDGSVGTDAGVTHSEILIGSLNTATRKTKAIKLGGASNPTIDFSGSGVVTATGNPATLNFGTGITIVGGLSIADANLPATGDVRVPVDFAAKVYTTGGDGPLFTCVAQNPRYRLMIGDGARCDRIEQVALTDLLFTAGGGTSQLGVDINAVTLYAAFREAHTNNGASPYTILPTDREVAVNTAAPVTILLEPLVDAGDGRVITISDRIGMAAANPVTITPDGAEPINGVAASVTINWNWGSLTLKADLSEGTWRIIGGW